MQEIYSKIERIADSRTTVLITEKVAREKNWKQSLALQQCPARTPFIALNCAALPERSLKANSSATKRGRSRMPRLDASDGSELANTGTLFLDEIGDLSPVTQAKLLRVIQEREFTRIGVQSIKVDVRHCGSDEQES